MTQAGPITRRRVAELAAVSEGTVSKVFNRPESVRAHTRERVLRMADKYGYRPNKAASALRRNGSGTILLLAYAPMYQGMARVYGVFYADAVAAVVDAINPSPYTLVMKRFSDRRELARELDAADSDGIVLFDLAMRPPVMELVTASSKPVVCCAQHCPDPTLNRVVVDEHGVGWLAGKRLLEAGLARPLVLTRTMSSAVHQARYIGFGDALGEASVPQVICADAAHAYTAIQEHIPALQAGEVDSVFAPDLMLYAAFPALLAAGLQVPRDVAAIGCDNLELPLPNQLRLESVDLRMGEVFRRGAEGLLELLAGSRERLDERIAPCLVPGNTVSPEQGDT
ncbi:MAG: LacI family DNA-binding transcriptional regulator [Lentisphaerae bacterium]|jgi:DNA-binding LacI/PurR family transcriptional regulator|nr:LacI family DNA-binding transcriptional regulator [Lentisphaerota bacterium]MBT4820948.1 LacI family DNA-binding transcriptional regulator [Lentisphaerota bacterium]MBT5612432.1 LacI family DNA-binding transcriptional regulator [Lentisphaerota bacterium]MBT7057138.1 LacI family DNA-binding transcriptional regulator [Lentisphaerota bacterium]MBT7847276.1 LacI family DNA-binding transcriptional regulator [Lentisphaerota bacterium]